MTSARLFFVYNLVYIISMTPMTIEEKQKIAEFIDLTGDFITSGYRGEKREYNFSEAALPEEVPALSVSQIDYSSQNEDSLEKIAAEIKICQSCPLAPTRKNTVPGEGVLNPLVLVIGEGPGADEDTQGRPFVGNAGQLLDQMLGAIKLSRNTNCFIANVVKCRPPKNRDPHPEEVISCAGFLKRQILFLKPKIILLVGNIASQAVLKVKEPVGKIRGKFFDFKIDDLSIPLMVTYHPSALLHNSDYKRPAWEDLKQLRAKIDSIDN